MKLYWWLAVVVGFIGTESNSADKITLNADTPWIVATNQPEPLQRALADVQRDWYKVFGHRPVVLTDTPRTWAGPLIRFNVANGVPETFSLRVEGETLAATGTDIRGLIYATYALAEKILGVDPWYFWTDHEPAARREIDVPGDLNEHFGPPTFRYRGWFINDEDLLSGFSPDPLRENVFSLEMLDRICETILRLRGNLIVPATFAFPDERCWEVAARRGLALNFHHIQVVGLNTYRWPKDVPFSYTKHPEIMERYWRDCIAAFKGREVVWTVGYRGKHDRPFWQDEPELKTSAARGAVITKAIARQVELIREADPQAMIIANLWMEGAEMMHAGDLKLPDGVVVVWADDGSGLIRDNGTVRTGQGTYYHTAMLSGWHNQLSEMVPPGRIYSELGRFARAGATNFFLVNVSDVRPVSLTTDCAMRFAWNAAPYLGRTDRENMDAFLADWSRRQFGEALANDVAALYARYFDISYHRRGTRHGENRLHFAMQTPDRSAQRFAATNRTYVAELAAAAESLAARVPAERRDFYQANVMTPIQIHLQSLAMLENYCAAAIDRDAAKAEQALRAADELFATLHRAETGKWPAWYFGERFVGVEGSRDQVRVLLAKLRGESVPPVRPGARYVGASYPELYQYQQPFLTNYPRLYPRTSQGKP